MILAKNSFGVNMIRRIVSVIKTQFLKAAYIAAFFI